MPVGEPVLAFFPCPTFYVLAMRRLALPLSFSLFLSLSLSLSEMICGGRKFLLPAQSSGMLAALKDFLMDYPI
jgi:hypothetical protein